jgi:shikimate dehydrogenase
MSRRYAEVIGDPIEHSKSPLIHGFWLDRLGIDAEYRRTRVLAEDLGDFVARRRADPDWCGCNVTIPHKLAIMAHVADPENVRASIGAMNTIARDAAGALFGTNTDAAGFFAPIAALPLAGKRAVVIGSGGAANAVLFALARAGIGSVTLLARNPSKAMALLVRFGLAGVALPLGTAPGVAALVVNASPLGMTGQPPLPFDVSALPDDAVVYDIVYTPVKTELLKAAAARGLATIDGLAMLVGQAAGAFEHFFGVPPPVGADDELRRLLTR